jgi:hypothetical protein
MGKQFAQNPTICAAQYENGELPKDESKSESVFHRLPDLMHKQHTNAHARRADHETGKHQSEGGNDIGGNFRHSAKESHFAS